MSFRNFLNTENVSNITVRSYVSDARFFFNWYLSFLKKNLNLDSNLDFSLVLKYINSKVLEVYKNFLLEENLPVKSINRKYSALRKLGSFCLSQRYISENVFENLKTISSHTSFPENIYHLEQFRHYLSQKHTSKSSIKGYLSDIRQFILWTN
jgi:site-specific recombinase XerD